MAVKRNKDFIDDLVELVDTTATSVKDNIDESLKNNGYDNITDFVSEGIDRAFGKRESEKPFSTSARNVVTSRYEYMKQLLENIHYGRRYRGYYREGYEQIITTYKEQLETYKNDLDYLESSIQYDLSKLTKESRSSRNKYREGQKDALEYILSELRYAKNQIMKRIQRELVKK